MRYHLDKVTRILVIFLLLNCFFWLIFAGLRAGDVYFFTLEGRIARIHDRDFYKNIQWAHTAIQLLLFLFFLIWIYRATHNMQRQFGQQSISAGWAVGWNFIPLANFIMVYRAMANLWHHFGPTPSRSGFLLSWWLLGFLMAIADIICSFYIESMIGSPENEAVATVVKVFILIGYIAANLMEIRIVRVITKGEMRSDDVVAGVFS